MLDVYTFSFNPSSLVKYEKTKSQRLTGEGHRARKVQTGTLVLPCQIAQATDPLTTSGSLSWHWNV